MSRDIFSYELKELQINHIDLGERVRQDLGDVAALAADLSQFGLHHPILVVEKKYLPQYSDNESTPYLLLAGGRRLKAATLNKWPSIPCKITQRSLSAWELNVIELHENLQRKNMTPLEEGQLKEKLHTAHQEQFGIATPGPGKDGHSMADTAKFLGESTANVSMDIKIAKYAKHIPELSTVKTKSEARKLVKEFEEAVLIKSQVKKDKTKLTTSSTITKVEDSRRNVIISRYIVGNFFEQVKKIEPRTIDFGEIDPDQVEPTFLQDITREYYRILKDNSWLIFWYPLEEGHNETRAALQKAGFSVCPMPAFWIHDKNYTATPSYRFGQRTESFFYAKKGNPRLGKLNHGNTFPFRAPKKDERLNLSDKPIELYEEILKTFLGDRKAATTVTGFAGSGNFILAADNLEHNVIGFDLSQDYKDKFILKVTEGVPGRYKTYKD